MRTENIKWRSLTGPLGEGRKDSRSQRGRKIPGEYGQPNQQNSGHLGSHRLKRPVQGLHDLSQVRDMYVIAVSLVLCTRISGNKCFSDSFACS